MDDLKNAFQTMGLQDNASKEEVEKRYTTLLKRERARVRQLTADQAASDAGGDPFAKITEAYRFILAYEDKKITTAFNEQEYGKFKGMAGQAQKLDHFWRYYKIHTFAAIALVAVIIYAINSYVDHRQHQKYLASLPPIDVKVSFFGMFMSESGSDDDELLNEAMLRSFPEWQRIDSSTVFVPQDVMSQPAYLQKAMVMLISEKPDIYIMDKNMFEWIGRQGALLDLDAYSELVRNANETILLKLSTERDERGEPVPGAPEYPFGIDLGKSRLAADLPLVGTDMIVGIRADSGNIDKAIHFLNTYLSSIAP